jgi:hypothetical protein
VLADPSLFAFDTLAYADLAWTANIDHPSSLPYASPWTKDLWWGMEQTLSYRLLLDTIMQFVGDNKRPCQAFLGYLKKTHQGLYLPNSPFGSKLVELAFELLYLRPPQVARADGKPIPRLARVEKFDPPASPVALSVYLINDPRIVSPAADTNPEKPEQDVLDCLAAIVHCSWSIQRTEDERQSDEDTWTALRKQLDCFRWGVLARDHWMAGNPHVLSPVPVANKPAQDHPCPEDIDDDPASNDVQQES